MHAHDLHRSHAKREKNEPQTFRVNKTLIIATSAADCFTICPDDEDGGMRVKLMKTITSEVALTHRNVLTDYLESP